MANISSSAPRRAASSPEKKSPRAANRAEKPAAIYSVLVNISSASRRAPRLLQMEKRVAPPMPSMSPVPWMKLYTGIAIFKAASPSVPRLLDTKNVSARI